MLRWMATILGAISLAGCQSSAQFYEAPQLERPQTDLVLEPVEFSIIVQDDVVYYALTSENYINLGINMLRIQQTLYDMAVWENLRDARSSETKNDRNKDTEREARK